MKKLVVIGGGFAGTYVARELEGKFNTTLIDTKDYFEFTPGILRAIVKYGAEKPLQVKHADYLKKTKILIGKAGKISSKYVIFKGKKIPYDYLAVCSGSRYNDPFKQENVLIASHTKDLEKYRGVLEKSQKIAIVGGGLVGVELAAEIAHFYPEKKVAIVHSQKSLLERSPKAAQRYALSYLVERKVWVVLKQMAVKIEDKKVVTDKGLSVDADVVFVCTGIKPNTPVFDKGLKKCVDARGNVVVNAQLQAYYTNNIFAAGDVNNIIEEKTAQNAEEQAKIVVQNILALENKRQLKQYSSTKRPMVLSLGPLDGLFIYKKFVYTGLLPAILKWFIERKSMWKFGK